eukprot:5610477-Pyramimonas_sp.AAC.1
MLGLEVVPVQAKMSLKTSAEVLQVQRHGAFAVHDGHMEVELSVSQRTRWSTQPSNAWYLSIPSRLVSNS